MEVVIGSNLDLLNSPVVRLTTHDDPVLGVGVVVDFPLPAELLGPDP